MQTSSKPICAQSGKRSATNEAQPEPRLKSGAEDQARPFQGTSTRSAIRIRMSML